MFLSAIPVKTAPFILEYEVHSIQLQICTDVPLCGASLLICIQAEVFKILQRPMKESSERAFKKLPDPHLIPSVDVNVLKNSWSEPHCIFRCIAYSGLRRLQGAWSTVGSSLNP